LEGKRMLNFRRMLCPVDFSPTARRAFDYAVALAARLGADVEVLHVYQPQAYLMPESVYDFPPALELNLTDRLLAQLNDFVKHQIDSGVTITTKLSEGVPHLEIVRIAQEHGVDLIVIGTHGHTGLSHLLLGSIAERVVRHSEVPVVTIRMR
jgi:nucleotide-binding universal stress UspA family protein